jgi:RHS repeat-associated protein
MLDENGNRTEYAYDAMNRPIRITEADPDGVAGPSTSPVTILEYDPHGNLVRRTDANGVATSYGYDARDRLMIIQDAADQTTAIRYDSKGNPTVRIDPLGFVTENEYDARGRVIKQIDGNGSATRFRYDNDNNMIQLTDPIGNVTRFRFDQRDRVIEEIDPLGAHIRYEYNAADDLIEKTDRNGRRLVFTYDAVGRLERETWIDASDVDANVLEYAYDMSSNLTMVSDAQGSVNIAYDARNRHVSVESQGMDAAPLSVIAYDYDAAGNVVDVSDVVNGIAGGSTRYAYDALNRNTSIIQDGDGVLGKRVDFTYDPRGQFTEIKRYSDTTAIDLVASSEYTYDQLSRLVRLQHSNGTSNIAFYDYRFDAGDRITQINSVDGLVQYTYDAIDQLLAADYDNATLSDELYRYDAVGSRVKSHLHGTEYETGGANRLLSDGTYNYEYDGEGNLIQRTEISSGNYRTLAWDHRNRLVAVVDFDAAGIALQTVDYTYDGLNRRIAKAVDVNPEDGIGGVVEHYIYDRHQVIRDVHLDEPSNDRRYLHADRLAFVLGDEHNESTSWYYADHRLSIRDVISTAGHGHRVLDSFGAVTMDDSISRDVRYNSSGREFEVELDLTYHRARYLSIELGRFISEDPLRLQQGVNTMTAFGNDPVNTTDPLGLSHVAVSESNSPNSDNGQYNRQIGQVLKFFKNLFKNLLCATLPFPGSAFCDIAGGSNEDSIRDIGGAIKGIRQRGAGGSGYGGGSGSKRNLEDAAEGNAYIDY